jgi:hypothetical protein
MEIGEIVEIGDRKVVVTPRQEPDPQKPQNVPVSPPERVKEPA